MHDAVDDRAEAARPAQGWPAEDGSSYAVRSEARRIGWPLPVLAVVVGLLLGAVAAALIGLH